MREVSVHIKATYRTYAAFVPRTYSTFDLTISNGNDDSSSSHELCPKGCYFPLACPGTGNSTFVIDNVRAEKDINKIKISRQSGYFTGDCFLESVVITEPGVRNYVFPFRRWLERDKVYTIRLYDCYLPVPGDDQRQRELEEMRNLYEYAVAKQDKYVREDGGDMPAQVLEVPYEDTFGFLYKTDIKIKNVGLKVREIIYLLFKGNNWKSQEDLTSVYSKVTGTPYGAVRWKKDFFFGWQRMNGLNPGLIHLCNNIRRMTEKIRIDEDEVIPYLDGLTLQGALGDKRLYMVDLAILTEVPTKEGFHCPAPVALFFNDDSGNLLPIAIQLDPPNRPGPEGPVFYPHDDPNTWLLAKMWYNLADASYHQSITHLGFTHLIMEGIAVCAHRQLSKSHPLFKLLAPHFFYLMAINDLARDRLINKGGWVDNVMNIGVQGMMTLISRRLNGFGHLPPWSLSADSNPRTDARERGIDDLKLLPKYYYREDSFEMFDAIHDYVKKYVNMYYKSDQEIITDNELQEFGQELTRTRPNKNDTRNLSRGCGLQGVFQGENTRFQTRGEVIIILSNVIFTCSVQHAAINFPQFNEYGFPGFYPLTLRGKPPREKRYVTDKEILQTLPNRRTTLEIMTITEILSGKGTKSLGDFEINWIHDPKAKGILENFRRRLHNISIRIKERNAGTFPEYKYLDSENIPNAISI